MAPLETLTNEGPPMHVRRRWPIDAGAALFFVLAAMLLTHRLWPGPAGRALALNPSDQALDEWFLAYATRAYRGDFSLVTGLLNAPDGVNLLCNASLIGMGLLLAPVTLAFGAPVTFSVLVAGNLAATGDRVVPAVRQDPRRAPGRRADRRGVRRLRAGHGVAVQRAPAHDGGVAGAADRLVRGPPRPPDGGHLGGPPGPACCSAP